MVYQPPAGARDLLPLDVVQKRWIEDRLHQVFHQWGYHRIITSTLERLEALMAGGAIDLATVIQLQNVDDEPLGLRPELTASIARAAVTRMAGVPFPLRLYYNANVFRQAQEGSHSRQHEFYQAGVELLGVGGLAADAEILLLLVECLNNLELNHWHLLLGEAGLTRSLLSPFPAALQPKVRRAIANLDRIGLETLPMPPELRDRALFLIDLRGNPADVLQQVASLDLNTAQQDAVTNLKSLIDLLQSGSTLSSHLPHLPPPYALPLTLDLSQIRTFDYYTGIVFEVVSHSPSGLQVLGQGGRYDQLLGLYHPQGKTYPGIGFSLQIENLHQVLLSTGQLPQQASTCDWLVVPETPQAYTAAFAHAQILRQSSQTVRVEVELGNSLLEEIHIPPGDSQRTHAEIHAYARHRHIPQIVWIKPNGEAVIETVT
jgi:ATP phosphoribosyltransferase regulatory subunit